MTALKLLGLLLLLGGFAASAGCENTTRGFGADLEQAGEDIQDQDSD